MEFQACWQTCFGITFINSLINSWRMFYRTWVCCERESEFMLIHYSERANIVQQRPLGTHTVAFYWCPPVLVQHFSVPLLNTHL